MKQDQISRRHLPAEVEEIKFHSSIKVNFSPLKVPISLSGINFEAINGLGQAGIHHPVSRAER